MVTILMDLSEALDYIFHKSLTVALQYFTAVKISFCPFLSPTWLPYSTLWAIVMLITAFFII